MLDTIVLSNNNKVMFLKYSYRRLWSIFYFVSLLTQLVGKTKFTFLFWLRSFNQNFKPSINGHWNPTLLLPGLWFTWKLFLKNSGRLSFFPPRSCFKDKWKSLLFFVWYISCRWPLVLSFSAGWGPQEIYRSIIVCEYWLRSAPSRQCFCWCMQKQHIRYMENHKVKGQTTVKYSYHKGQATDEMRFWFCVLGKFCQNPTLVM